MRWPATPGWVRDPRFRSVRDELFRAWPYALLLALALGGALALGVNLSNAWPSANKPFGWPGPSSFDNGVAMVRTELVLAASVPGLLLGLGTPRRLDPARDGSRNFLARIGVDVVLLTAAPFAAAGLGAWAASKSTGESVFAFGVAHALLALAFYSIAFLAQTLLPRYGGAPALTIWIVYVVLLENLLQWRLFREVGYHALKAGQLPVWFFATQLASPFAAYRGVLILWRPGFRGGIEQAALKDATLPAWVAADTFVVLLIFAWVILPLEVAALAFAWRAERSRRPSARRAGATGSEPLRLVDPLPRWMLKGPVG